MKRLLLGLLLSGALLASSEFTWQDNGIAIRQGVHIEWQRSGDIGATGEMIIAWSDTRSGDRDVYVQKFDTLGTRLWGETGIQATVAAGRQEDPVLVTDGAGGLFLAWIDYRDDDYGDVYAQYIDADGNLQWDPAGVPLAVNDGSQQSVNMAKGAPGHAVVIWDDGSLSEQGDIFGTVLSASGPLAAGGTNGLPLVDHSGRQSSHSIENSGDEVVVVWWDNRETSNPNIYGQRLDMDFNHLWTDDGVLICGAATEQTYPKVAPADGDRVAVSWIDPRYHDKGDVYSQLINSDGSMVWTADGIALTDITSEQNHSRVKSNGTDIIYYIWEDFRNDSEDPDIYAQALNLDGTPHWTAGGISVCSATLKQLQPRFTLNPLGGIFVTWLDERNGGFPESDIYLQLMQADGGIGFELDGVALTDSLKYQTGALVRPDGAGGAMVVWGDASTGSIGIVGQHVSSAGSLTWDADGQEFFFGIDGDATGMTTMPWGDESALVFWEDHRRAALGATATAQVVQVDGAIAHDFNGKALATNKEQARPTIAKDNTGGAYLGFLNKTTGTENLYMQHVDTGLDPTWDPQGIRVYALNWGAQRNPRLVTGSDDHLYYMWSEERLGPFTIYIQRFDADGTPQWADGGVEVGGDLMFRDKYVRDAVALEDGGVLFTWQAVSWDDVDLYVSKILPDGSLDWSSILTDAPGYQERPVMAYDTTTGLAYIGWQDSRAAALNGVDLYLVSVNAAGELSEEVVISDAPGDQTTLALSLADDGSGTLMAAWEDYIGGLQHDIFVRNLTAETEAVQITNQPSENLAPALRAIDESRYFVVWEDFRHGIHSDLYLYDSQEGHDYHVADGVPLCLAVLGQSEPHISEFAFSTPDSFAYLITWQDMRASGKTELTNIYGQVYRTTSTTSTVVTHATDFKLEAAYPNPFNGAVRIPVHTASPEAVMLRIYDLRGREIYRSEQVVSGRQVLTWHGEGVDLTRRASGLFFAQVEVAGEQFTQKLMYLK